MKTIILSVALGFAAFGGVFAQIPDYFSDNPKWHCSEWNSDQWDPTIGEYTVHYVYYLSGDTTLNGRKYHQVFRTGWSQEQQ